MNLGSSLAIRNPAMGASSLRHAASIAAAVALMAASAQVRIPLPFTPVPVTLQTAAVLFSGVLLGRRSGIAATLAYLGLGAAGLPFFAGGAAGLACLWGSTAGYLLGFVAAAALVGSLPTLGQSWARIAAVLSVGEALIHLCGVAVLAAVTGKSLSEAFVLGSLPFLPGAVAKIGFVATALHAYGAPLSRWARGPQADAD